MSCHIHMQTHTNSVGTHMCVLHTCQIHMQTHTNSIWTHMYVIYTCKCARIVYAHVCMSCTHANTHEFCTQTYVCIFKNWAMRAWSFVFLEVTTQETFLSLSRFFLSPPSSPIHTHTPLTLHTPLPLALSLYPSHTLSLSLSLTLSHTLSLSLLPSRFVHREYDDENPLTEEPEIRLEIFASSY